MIRNNNRYRRDPRQVDEEEELWFQDDGEEGEVDDLDQPLNDLNYKIDQPRYTDDLNAMPSLKKSRICEFDDVGV